MGGVGGPGGPTGAPGQGGNTGGWSFGDPPYGGSNVYGGFDYGGSGPVPTQDFGALNSSYSGQGMINGVPMGGNDLGGHFGDPPGALSNLGEVTPSSVASLVAGPIGSALGSFFGGPLGGIGGGFLGNALAALMSGKDIGQAALSLPASLGGYALGNIGQSLGPLGSLALGLLGSNLIGSAVQGNQGTAPDVGASIAASGPDVGTPEVGTGPTGEASVASAGASPVAEAMAPVQVPMLSSQPFGWYSQGMKRVNMPWVSQPGSQQLRYNQSGNYGGMKRV